MEPKEFSLRKMVSSGIAVVVGLFFVIGAISSFEYLDAGNIMVIQSPFAGNLTWYTTPGVKWQGFGKVTKYPKRTQFWFSYSVEQGKKVDESIPIRFNDGGHGRI